MRLLILNCVVFLVWCSAIYGEPIPIADVEPSKALSFEQDVLPIFQRSCLACHSASEEQGGLVLETPQSLRDGGDSGPAIVPGKGAESLLLKLAAHQEESFMPPPDNDVNAAKLTSQELGLLRLWIDQGARGAEMPMPASPLNWQALSSRIDPVYALALSSDGKHVAVPRANQLFVYDVTSGEMLANLQDSALEPAAAHRDLIQSLAWSTDGSLLASGGFQEVKLWRKPDAVPLQRFSAEERPTVLTVSPDRKWLATAGANPTIQLWNTETGQPGPKLTGHGATITALRFTADGQRLISTSQDETIRIWKCDDGSAVGVLESPSVIQALELVATALPTEKQPAPPQILVTGGADKMVRTWTIPQMAPQRLESATELQRLAVSDDGQRIATIDSAGTIVVRQAASDAPHTLTTVAQWKPEPGVPDHLVFVGSAAEGMLATETKGEFRLWKLPEHQQVAQWREEPAAATDSASSEPATTEPAAAAPATEPSAPESPETATTETAATETTALTASADGTLLGSGTSDGRILLWNVAAKEGESPRLLRAMEKMEQPITALRFSSDGQSLFAASQDGAIRAYATSDGKPRFTANHGAAVRDLALSPDQQVLATAGEDAIVRLWKANGEAYQIPQLQGLSAPATRVSFSADGTGVLVGTGGETPRVHVFDLKTGIQQQRFSSHGQPVLGLASSSNGVISASADGLWQWTLHGRGQTAGHTETVTSLVAVPNQPMQVFSGSLDGTIRRWDLTTLQQLGQFDHGGPVLDIDVRLDGQRIASVSSNHTAKLWDAAGKQIAEMKGDILRRKQAARMTRELNAANQKLAIVKQRLVAAEEIVVARVEAEKTAAEALAAANEDVQAKKLALEQLVAEEAPADDAAKQTAKADAQQAFQDAEAAQKLALQKQTSASTAVKSAEKRVAETKQFVAESEANATQMQAALDAANKQVAESERPLHSVYFSPDGNRVATAGEFPSAQTWDAETGAALDAIPAQAAPLHPIAFLDDRRLASASGEPEVVVWDLDPQWHLEKTLGAADLLAGRVTSLDFNLAGSQLLVGGGVPSRSGELSLFDVAEGGRIHFLPKAHNDVVYAAKFSPDGTQLVSAGADKLVRTWDLETDSPLSQLEGHTDYALGVAWKEDAQAIVTASADQTIKVWNVETADQQRTIPGFAKDVTAVRYVGETNNVISSCGDGTVRLHNAANGGTIRNFGAGVWLHCADATPDGTVVVAGSDDGRLFVWDGSNGKQLRVITVGK